MGPPMLHDARYFPQTGFRIDDDAFWNYFRSRGGVQTFGYPTSRTFLLLGCPTQFFQGRAMQLGPDGSPRLLNLFDADFLPYTQMNGSMFPAADPALLATVPQPGTPEYAAGTLQFIRDHVPDVIGGVPTNFLTMFSHTVPPPNPDAAGNVDLSLLPGLDLEMWGVVTSRPTPDPTNPNLVYLRFQRGIMMYDATANVTQSVLLADYLKAIITGRNLPPDLAAAAQQSRFFGQYNDAMPLGLNQPALLPGTNMQFAFDPG